MHRPSFSPCGLESESGATVQPQGGVKGCVGHNQAFEEGTDLVLAPFPCSSVLCTQICEKKSSVNASQQKISIFPSHFLILGELTNNETHIGKINIALNDIVKSSPKSTPSQANELQDSVAVLLDVI